MGMKVDHLNPFSRLPRFPQGVFSCL
jgi:hypothetical protein